MTEEDRIAAAINEGVKLSNPFIASHEGYRHDAYWDAIGKKWTVGHGHTYKEGRRVVNGDKMTAEESLKAIDKKNRENAIWIRRNLPWSNKLNARQLAALYDIAYNAGVKTLSPAKSPRLNEAMGAKGADYDDVLRRQLLTYVSSGGKKIKGLVNRRNDAVVEFIGSPF